MNIILAQLKNHYQNHFDLKEQPEPITFPLDLYAHFYQRNERYFATKNINLWRLDTEEHCLVKVFDHISQENLYQMTEVLKESISHLVHPHPDHMKTYITGVIISEGPVSNQLAKDIECFKYSKSFKFSLYGWCDLRLVVFDSSSQQVFYNKAAKEVKGFYQTLLERID